MLSMCGLLCRMLRGWRHSEAVMLMAKALSQPHSSLLVQDIVAADTGGVSVNEPCGTSPFCQNSSEGTLGQQLWRDNNKQAVIIDPKQCVDLQRWTLFLSSSDNPSSPLSKHPSQQASENGTSSTGNSEASGTITVLLEATYRETDDEPIVDYHVMVEQLSQPYAWKARDVFGVIVTTTPPQLLAMIQAFFNNALLIDDDFLIKKILTIEVIGQPSTLEDPLSIPQCVTPGPWNVDRVSLTQMEIARGVSPIGYPGQPPLVGCGNLGLRGNSLRPPLLSALLRHQSSGESATDTSTTLNPQSSSDSDKHPSSLDPQSSYDSVSDYPTSDADDVSCNVYNFYPRGWAVSGNQIISGQPLSVRGVLTQLEGKFPNKPCSILTNPMEDLWQEPEDAQKVIDDSCTSDQSLLCLNGPSRDPDSRSTLPRIKKDSRVCLYPYRCLPGSVLCKRVGHTEPGKKEREIVKEAAEYYQRALYSAQERREWAKKSLSSTSDEDTLLNEYSFSGTQDEAVVTHEPKKYPVRIKSEADLSRASSIIKDNLANIVQRYLVKSANSPDCQYLYPKIPSENPTLKLPYTSDEPQVLTLQPRGVQEPDSQHVDITVVKAEVTEASLVRITEQVAPITEIESFRQGGSLKYVNAKKEERLVPVVDNKEKIEQTIPQIVPSLFNQSFTKQNEQKPDIQITDDKKTVCAANCRQSIRSSGKSEKKLIKSEEIVPPTMKRESRIDIPMNIEDELKSRTPFDHEDAKVKVTVIREDFPYVNMDTSNEAEGASQNLKLVDVATEKTNRIFTDKPVNTGIKETDRVHAQSGGKHHDDITNISFIKDKRLISTATKKYEQIPSEVLVNVSVAKSEKLEDVRLKKVEGTFEITREEKEDNANKPATAEDFYNIRLHREKVQDLDVTTKMKELVLIQQVGESIIDTDVTSSESGSHDGVPTLKGDKNFAPSVTVVEPNAIITITSDIPNVTVQINDSNTEPSLVLSERFADIPIILDEMQQNSPLKENESYDPYLHSNNWFTNDVVIFESTEEKGDDSLDANEDVATRLTKRPKCLKDINKLNTKSSTASESSFESLPYRMLTSQPDSLTDDIAIELTQAPPDSEKLRAARLELIRQERINAISLHSISLMESKDESTFKSDSPEEEEEHKTEAKDMSGGISHIESTLVDSLIGATHICDEGRQQDGLSSALFDSGVEVMMQDHGTSVTSSLIKSFPSPVDSVPESGFSSLKEPLANEGTNEDGGFDDHIGVSLSKSKDSLDLTDTDRFPGTDTLSDDMETLSLSTGDVTLVESGPVSTVGSARGSISEFSQQDTGRLKFYSSEPSNLDLGPVGVLSSYQENSSYYSSCDSEKKQLPAADFSHIKLSSDSSAPEHYVEECASEEIAHSCSEIAKVSPDVSKSNLVVRLDEKAIRWLSGDGSGSKMKTSESLSSDDTVISRLSFEEHNAKLLSQGSQEEPTEFSESPSRISPNDEKDEKTRKDLFNITVQSTDYNKEAVNSKTESAMEDTEMVNEMRSSDDAAVVLKGQQVTSFPDKVINECQKEKYSVHVDGKDNMIRGESTSSSEKAVDLSIGEDCTSEISRGTDFIEKDETVTIHEVVGHVYSSTRDSRVDSMQNNIELHLSIADKLKLLTSSEPVSDSVQRDESYGIHNVKNPDHVMVEDFSHQSEKSYEVGYSNSIEGSTSLPPNKESKVEKTGDMASSNTDVIVSVTSENSKKSDVSERSSPNANETCSTCTSDRPSRHSSKSGVSDLEDEVFLPPKENYIFDGRPVIYCPKIDMANQIGISPPKVAMSVFAVVPSKHTNIGKEEDWIASGKEDLLKFANYSTLAKLTNNGNMQEVNKTENLTTQPTEITSLPVSRVTAQDHFPDMRGKEMQLIEELRETHEGSVNVLTLSDTTWKDSSKQGMSLDSSGRLSLEKELTCSNDTREAHVLDIEHGDCILLPETKGDTINVADGVMHEEKMNIDGKYEEIIQSDYHQRSESELAVHIPIPESASRNELKAENSQQSNLNQVVYYEYMPMMGTEGKVSEDLHDSHMHKVKTEIKSEEKSSTETQSNINLVKDSLFSCAGSKIFELKTSQLHKENKECVDQEVTYSSKSSPKEIFEPSKPRLLRMPNLERTDTTVSPIHQASLKVSAKSGSTPQESPVVSPAVTCDMKKVPFPVTNLPVDAYGSSSPVSREATDEENSVIENIAKVDVKLKSTSFGEKTDSDPEVPENAVERAYITEFSSREITHEEARILGRGGSAEETSTRDESLTRSPEPELKKYGSEELSSILTSDSRGSSASKSYLEPDLRSVNSSWGASGSLECLESDTDSKGSHTHRHGSITTAKSEELGMKCDKVSLKSQGSLDKFPHFDQVTSQQKARGARKKVFSVDIESKDKKNTNKEMHRSVTLPAGSMSSSKKEEKKKDKEEKSKKKKKDGVGNSEKKSAMLSLKGLLKRNKSKEKEKDKDKDSSREKLSSPSLFRKLEKKTKSNTQSPLLDERKQGEQGNVINGSRRDVEKTKHSPVATNGKTRPVISSPVSVQQVGNMAGMGVATTICRGNGGLAASGSDSDSPIGSRQSSPKRIISHPRMASLGTQPSPRLYKHVLTRHLSSSQESVDNPLLSSTHSSPQASPHTSPKRIIPASASSYSLPASRDMSPPAPVMGTRALRGSNNSFSVTIGFKPKVEKRNRTMSEGADLNKVSLSPVSKRKEGSRILTQLNKRSSSMEILVCGKIREHCSQSGKSPSGSPFSREGSFRLHREISVETLFELPETSPRSSRTQEEYQEYLNEIHARNDSQHGSSWSLVEESEIDKVKPDTLSRRSSHHTPAGKKLSLPHNMHLSGLCETASSNPNLQRTGSPFVRGVSHSSSFTSSPYRRPHSSAAVYSPAKRVMSTSVGGSPSSDATPGMPLMRVEEEGPCRKNLDAVTEKPPNVLVYAANKVERILLNIFRKQTKCTR
ncbi:uncharacterized protein LOC121871347 [Homarus americanus]|uniref:uncharacterized protein LOC121871347 n=1 Tax=Homarus americanus TaxID=6706 RepID=UPI001C451386|nr:uncharacterized protein LOC121871347 [Homarus americanus]